MILLIIIPRPCQPGAGVKSHLICICHGIRKGSLIKAERIEEFQGDKDPPIPARGMQEQWLIICREYALI